jgi:hypothetical protein
MEQAGKKIGQKLYNNDIDKIMSDINAVMDLHAKGESADIHFKKEYGADWKAHKDFINSTFGDISGGAKARPADYMMINPVLVTDRPSNAVFKTYRLDRLNKATAMEGTTGIPMDYNMVKANYMPDGVPLFHENGDPVDMRYTPVEDENGNLRAVPSENYGKQNNKQVEETGGLPPEQGIPADRTTAVQTQEGTPLGESTSQEGQVVPPSESSNQYMPENIDDIRKQWDDLGIQHNLSERNNEIEPGIINVPKPERNMGIGNKAMSILIDYSDRVGKRIVVSPTSEFGSSKQRLTNWYKKLGFVENKGRNKDYTTRKTMYRDPISQTVPPRGTGDINRLPKPASSDIQYMPETTGGKETPAKNATVEDFSKPDEFYRVIRGKKAFDDIVESGVVRTDYDKKPTGVSIESIQNRPTSFPSFSKGKVSEGYIAGENNHYVIVTSDPSMAPSTKGKHGKGSTMFPTDPNGKALKSLDASNVDVYKHVGEGKYDLVYSKGQEVKSQTQELAPNRQYMPEVVDPEDKGIQAPIGALGELRKNVDIRKSDLPADATSVPKFVARQGADGDWKVMEGPLRVARGNYLTPLPNIKIKKTKVSVQNQNLIQNSFLARDTNATTPKELNDKQNAIRNANDALAKIDSAVKEIESDPQKFVDPKGYAETMKKAGVTGDVLIPPSSLKMMLNDPDSFAALLSGGYHGDKTVAGIRDSAMSGLDSVVEMRELIGGRPPELITAIHHLWGTLSKQLPPLQQEALWMRMITNKDVMKQIGESINGTYNQSPEQWKNTVKKARSSTVGTYGKLGNNATSNANSFYLMLSKHNGRWNEVSDVYKYDDPVQMRYAFNTLGHGATGIKNKVQSFIGLTFGIKGNVLDRWRFVDMYLDDAMKITGAKNAREYFKYEGKKKNVPVDKIGIYKNYGTIENKSPLFSLALYSGMDRVSQAAINASPALQTLLGNHADPGGLHWLSWNAIKNEAVGHSSLDITKNFIKQYAKDGKFNQLTVDNFLKFVNSTEAFVEGTSGGGEEITRLTLKNGVFSHSKK